MHTHKKWSCICYSLCRVPRILLRIISFPSEKRITRTRMIASAACVVPAGARGHRLIDSNSPIRLGHSRLVKLSGPPLSRLTTHQSLGYPISTWQLPGARTPFRPSPRSPRLLYSISSRFMQQSRFMDQSIHSQPPTPHTQQPNRAASSHIVTTASSSST